MLHQNSQLNRQSVVTDNALTVEFEVSVIFSKRTLAAKGLLALPYHLLNRTATLLQTQKLTMIGSKAFSPRGGFYPGNGAGWFVEPVRVDPAMGGYAPVQDSYVVQKQRCQ